MLVADRLPRSTSSALILLLLRGEFLSATFISTLVIHLAVYSIQLVFTIVLVKDLWPVLLTRATPTEPSSSLPFPRRGSLFTRRLASARVAGRTKTWPTSRRRRRRKPWRREPSTAARARKEPPGRAWRWRVVAAPHCASLFLAPGAARGRERGDPAHVLIDLAAAAHRGPRVHRAARARAPSRLGDATTRPLRTSLLSPSRSRAFRHPSRRVVLASSTRPAQSFSLRQVKHLLVISHLRVRCRLCPEPLVLQCAHRTERSR